MDIKKKTQSTVLYLIVDVNSPSSLPAAAHDRLPKCQPLVTMVTSCCIGILVVELQSAL